jgi:hypothetical protein
MWVVSAEMQLPDILQKPPKTGIRGMAHNSISIQEGQPASPVSTGLHAKGCQNRANRGISGLCVGLRVPNLSVEVQISLIVSGAVFRCLVFAGAQGPINLCSNRRGGALENMPMARKNAIVHVNDKMQRVLVMLHRGGQLAQPTIGIADVVLDIGVAWVA